MVYHHYEHVPTFGWEKNDTLYFSIPPIKASGNYHEEVELRTDESFPFLGLTLLVEQTVWPKGEHHHYTLNCSMADKNGNIKGRGISCYQYEFPLADLHLQEGDSLQIAIIHNMKREIMPGITDVGISFCFSPHQSAGR